MRQQFSKLPRRVIGAIAIVAAVAIVLGTPALVWAHARLTRSDPAAKATLSVAPTRIRLWFSEAPEIAMSRVTLTDSSGTPIPLGKVERGAEKLLIETSIGRALAAGRYTVTWHVAAADGHPSNGSFTFTVAPHAAPASESSSSASRPGQSARDSTSVMPMPMPPEQSIHVESNDASGFAQVAVRAMTFGSMLVVIGGIVFVLVILSRATGLSAETHETVRVNSARVVAIAAITLAISAAVRLTLQSRMMAGMMHEPAALTTVLNDTAWGRAWLAQVAATIVVGLAVMRGRSTGAWVVAACSAAVLAATPALSGHAAAAARWTALAIGADTLHVIAAAGWLGSLVFVVVVGISTLIRSADEARWSGIASLVEAFSPAALTFAAIVLVTGSVSAWLRLGSVPALWSSGYGRTLLVKLALLAGAVGTGAYNWRRVRPSLGTEIATTRLRRSAAAELAIGALVVIVTAVLVATPTPADLP